MNAEGTQIDGLLQLTEDQRLQAQERARELVRRKAGDAPKRDAFSHATITHYTGTARGVITLFMFGMIAFLFLLSSMRLFHIGRATFLETIAHDRAATAAGVAVIFGAELGTLGFTLFAGLLERRREKAVVYAFAGASAVLALVGNVQQGLGAGWLNAITSDPFAFLESVLPPVTVIGGAYVLKHFLLEGMIHRQENERAYQAALAAWRERYDNPEQAETWPRYYRAAIREQLQQVNGRGRGAQARIATMEGLTVAQWHGLVQRELDAERAWDAPLTATPAGVIARPLAGTPAGVIALPQNGNGNSHRNGNGNG